MSFFISSKIKGKPPRLPFIKIKEHILGKKYDLSLVFIGSTRSRTLNYARRGKRRPANVLSFPLTDNTGEIFIDLKEARKNAKDFNMNTKNFVGFLFIHGLLHLKGFEHGSNMKSEETKARKKFDIEEME